MIEQVHIEKVGCLRSTDITLTKFHALIGPNDSGKSLILRTIANTVELAWRRTKADTTEERRSLVRLRTAHGEYALLRDVSGQRYEDVANRRTDLSLSRPAIEAGPALAKELEAAVVVDFDPPELRAPSELLPDALHIQFLETRGRGLPGIYDAILNSGDRSFYAISDALAAMFPTVRRLRLNAVSNREKQLEVELKSGQRIPAAQLSEGILYFLAYAALQYIKPTPILLIEEPETGLHPARIREVMTMFRKISEAPDGPQIVMATHSPLVINEMKPDEVSLVTRSVEEGTKVVCIKDTPFFKERHEVMSLGELWLNYCDGVEEAPLLKGDEA